MKFTKLIGCVGFAIMAGAAVSCVSDHSDDQVWSLAPGDDCPQFEVTLNNGVTTGSTDLRGCASMIVFFNTSCSDCRRELPEVQQVYDATVSDPHLRVLVIARDEQEGSISQYWKEQHLTMPYSPQPDRSVYNLFATSIIPRIFIVGPDMKIRAVYTDDPMPDAPQLLKALREAGE